MEDTGFRQSAAQRKEQEMEVFIAACNAAAVSLSGSALKALLILNGGAAIAMLGFVASIASKGSADTLDLEGILLPLQAFAFGAGLAVLATGLAYVVMYLQAVVAQSFEYIEEPPFYASGPRTPQLDLIYKCFHVAAIFVSIFSLTAFAFGVIWTGGFVEHSSVG